MKESMQDLIMITGILTIMTGICILGASMPTQNDTAQNIKNILSGRSVIQTAIAQK